GVARVRGVFRPASLDALLRAVLDAWVASGGAAASAWALRAVGHLGSDDLARDLAARVRRWPREKAKPRALMGVEVLGAMGTDLATAAKARWRSLREDFERVRASLLLRMELAMVRGRRWDPGAVEALFARHPIAGRAARRLVWGVFEGDGRGRLVETFRVTE